MLRVGSGSIVNNSSIGGSEAAEAKHTSRANTAWSALPATAALTYGPDGIRVNAIGPGIVATETYLDNLASRPEMGLRTESTIPLGRVSTTGEVAEVVAWLCSDASSYVTGAMLPVDGGLSETDSAHWDASPA